ncbi:MAG: hypothetical protein CMJ78_07035 [Planctomycetaceae bacterium]|nr:hypothetical protein [Planctomycetaceae bacterium]
MLCRSADSIFWMARYVERIENISRFLSITLQTTLDSESDDAEFWQPLVALAGDTRQFRSRFGRATEANVIEYLTFDNENSNSISELLRQARENARSLRETLSSEMWEQLNVVYLQVQETSLADILAAPEQFFSQLRLSSLAFNGIVAGTLSHGLGYHFARLGSMLERADQTLRLLDVRHRLLLPSIKNVETPIDDVQWAAVLGAASAYEMYRQRHHQITPDRVVDFLLFDPEFPRSARFCVSNALDAVKSISRLAKQDTVALPAFRRLSKAQSQMVTDGIDDLMLIGVSEYISSLETGLRSVTDDVFSAFMQQRAA